MKMSPEAVTIPEGQAWKNRRLACGIVTQLLPAPFNFLEWRAPRAKDNLKSMEQCFRGRAGKCRLFAPTLFHDCSTLGARQASSFTAAAWGGHSLGESFSIEREK